MNLISATTTTTGLEVKCELDDTVHMRMMGHGRAPSVEHGSEPDLRAEILGISAYRGERLGGALEQQIVDHRVECQNCADR